MIITFQENEFAIPAGIKSSSGIANSKRSGIDYCIRRRAPRLRSVSAGSVELPA
jgi:hypothetical protein